MVQSTTNYRCCEIMPEIHFDAIYRKMPNFEPARLLQVFKIDRFDLSLEFLKHDLRRDDGTFYHLSSGPKMVLWFRSVGGELWPTIRDYTPEQYQYYEARIGLSFDIIIDGHPYLGRQ